MDEEMSGVVQQEEAAPASDLDNIAQDQPEAREKQPETETAAEVEEEGPETTEPEQKEEPIPNSVWKAARKRAEADANKRFDSEVARRCAGMKNPITGSPITTMKEYWDALDAQAELRRRAAIDQATKNVGAEQAAAIRQILENDPEKARMKARLDDLEHREIETRASAQLEKDVRELSKIDPAIRSMDDLSRLPEFGEIVSLVQSGATLANAYKIARYDAAVTASEKSGRQAAINAARGKTHLASHGGNPTPGNQKAIPADWVSMMKDQFPGKSMDELTKLYNQTL